MSEIDSNFYFAFKVRDFFKYDLEILRNYRNFLLTLCMEEGVVEKVAGERAERVDEEGGAKRGVGGATVAGRGGVKRGGIHAVLMDLFVGESWNELEIFEESERLRRVWEILDITKESVQKLSEGVDAALQNCVFFKECENEEILCEKETFISYLEKRETALTKCKDQERKIGKEAETTKNKLFEYLKMSSELIRKNDRI